MCNFLSGSSFQTCSETCLGCIHKTSPSIGQDLICILDEHDDEDVIDTEKKYNKKNWQQKFNIKKINLTYNKLIKISLNNKIHKFEQQNTIQN